MATLIIKVLGQITFHPNGLVTSENAGPSLKLETTGLNQYTLRDQQNSESIISQTVIFRDGGMIVTQGITTGGGRPVLTDVEGIDGTIGSSYFYGSSIGRLECPVRSKFTVSKSLKINGKLYRGPLQVENGRIFKDGVDITDQETPTAASPLVKTDPPRLPQGVRFDNVQIQRGQVDIQQDIFTDEFSIDIQGSSDCSFNFPQKKAQATLNVMGSGSIRSNNNVIDSVKICISGSGSVSNMKCTTLEAVVNGSGRVQHIDATTSAKLWVNGSGRINNITAQKLFEAHINGTGQIHGIVPHSCRVIERNYGRGIITCTRRNPL